MTHYHVATGLAGYGPDAADTDGYPTFDTAQEALSYARDELTTWIDFAAETAQSYAAGEDYEQAWKESQRADDLETLRANLDPARREAPLYRDNPTAYQTLVQEQVGGFPHDVSYNTRLYLWQCDESECADEDEPSEWETVSVSLLAVPRHAVAASVDVERIAEDVLQAAYVAAHEGTAKAEGFKRYGDTMPGELQALIDLSRLIVRSVLANGRMDGQPLHDYEVTHTQTGDFLMRTRAVSPLEALSNYSEAQGFARPDQLTFADTDGQSLEDFLGYYVSNVGADAATIIFTNHSVTATRVQGGVEHDA